MMILNTLTWYQIFKKMQGFQINSSQPSETLWKGVTKKKREILATWINLSAGLAHTSCIAEVLLKQQHLPQILFLHQIPYRHLNLIVLILWTTRDRFLSWFLFKESTHCFIRVAAHTQNNKNPTPTNLTTSHGSSQKLDKEVGSMSVINSTLQYPLLSKTLGASTM
jgi:hypothetical protein